MPLFLLHALLMMAGFLTVFAALTVAMTQRRKKWWLKTHKALGLTGSSLILLGAITAIAAVSATPQAHHLRSPHTWLGAATVLAVIITPTLGLLQFRIPRKVETLRVAHRLSGRIVNLMAPVAILLGLRVAGIV
ncbi:MAG: hypothetical protein AB1558_11895 [Thermodesulfobacteriota bacterium]